MMLSIVLSTLVFAIGGLVAGLWLSVVSEIRNKLEISLFILFPGISIPVVAFTGNLWGITILLIFLVISFLLVRRKYKNIEVLERPPLSIKPPVRGGIVFLIAIFLLWLMLQYQVGGFEGIAYFSIAFVGLVAVLAAIIQSKIPNVGETDE